MGSSAAQKLMAQKDKYEPVSHETSYRLALESILRWTYRQGYPHDKIKAIRTVATTALQEDA